MSEWSETTLGEFISLQRGHDLPNRERRPGSIPVIGSGGISGYHDTAKVEGPGITIGRAANLGAPVLINGDFWPLNTTLYVTDFRGNDTRFTYYLLRTLDLTGFNSGSVQPMLNRNYIKNFPLRVPKPDEQRAIAEMLGVLDEKININACIFDMCHSLGDELLRAGIPEISATATIGEMARAGALEFGDGYRTKRSEHGRPGLPILRVAEVLEGRIAARGEDYVSESYRRSMGSKTSKAEDVILTTKGTVGRVAIIPDEVPEFVYSPQLCYFRPRAKSGLTPSYLFFWFRSASFWAQARSLKSQTDMADYLNLSDIRSLAIEVPGSESGRLLERLSLLQDEASQKQRESESLVQMRDTLLPKLMSGEIRVREAEKLVEEAT